MASGRTSNSAPPLTDWAQPQITDRVQPAVAGNALRPPRAAQRGRPRRRIQLRSPHKQKRTPEPEPAHGPEPPSDTCKHTAATSGGNPVPIKQNYSHLNSKHRSSGRRENESIGSEAARKWRREGGRRPLERAWTSTLVRCPCVTPVSLLRKRGRAETTTGAVNKANVLKCLRFYCFYSVSCLTGRRVLMPENSRNTGWQHLFIYLFIITTFMKHFKGQKWGYHVTA